MKNCYYCKELYSPFNERSFHLFPKTDALRQKWIEILQLPASIDVRNKYICSDHFDKDSFFEFHEGQIRKRLLLGAIPSSINVEDKNEVMRSSDCSDVLTENNVSDSKTSFPRNIDIYDDKSKSIPHIITLCISPSTSKELDLSGNDSNYASVKKTQINSDISTKVNLKIRKKDFNDGRKCKKIKFRDGPSISYFARKDFSSEASWTKFLMFKRLHDLQIAAAYKKNSRRKKRVIYLENMIEHLQKQNKMENTNYLKSKCVKNLNLSKCRQSDEQFEDRKLLFQHMASEDLTIKNESLCMLKGVTTVTGMSYPLVDRRQEPKKNKEKKPTPEAKRTNERNETGSFCRSTALSNHQLVHNENPAFLCERCSKGFRTKLKLGRHLKTHSDDKPFVCFVCSRSYKQSSNLSRHMRIHTNVKPYGCPQCDESFRLDIQRKSHLLKYHKMGLPVRVNDDHIKVDHDYF